MTQVQLKEVLIKRIQETDDKSLLEDFLKILGYDQFSDEPIALDSEQRKAIDQGEQDFKKGDYLSEVEADLEAKKWLEK